MKPAAPNTKTTFDAYASAYDSALAQGLAVSGEDKSYFIHGRIAWLSHCLRSMDGAFRHVLDFGCGTGAATPYFFELLGNDSVTGVDLSTESLAIANKTHGTLRARFLHYHEYQPAEREDLVFCNGVFHHIPIQQRGDAVAFAHRSLRRGGAFSFWENNPWNPGARLVMSRIPFDRDAIMISAPQARKLLKSCGFEIIRTDFLFIFPRILSFLRRLERRLSPLPLGAQYQILCRKS
ncbi:MAG: methyltransferase domain-containing protein [Acidobacteriota bacterium]|jgi:predicted TPR repeat methyltransferase